MKADRLITCLLLSMLCLSGCTTLQPQFQVEVDSIKESDNKVRSYLLLPGNEDVIEDDLQFKKYAAYVHRALGAKGFDPAESFRKANIVIFLSYGIGDPQEHRFSYSLPIWGRTFVSTPYLSRSPRSSTPYGSNSGATASRPPHEFARRSPNVVTYRTHDRFMVLDAFALREHKGKKGEDHLWRTTAKSTGRADNLYRVFPVLVAAAQPYIATSTGKDVEVRLSESDERVMKILGADVTAEQQ